MRLVRFLSLLLVPQWLEVRGDCGLCTSTPPLPIASWEAYSTATPPPSMGSFLHPRAKEGSAWYLAALDTGEVGLQWAKPPSSTSSTCSFPPVFSSPSLDQGSAPISLPVPWVVSFLAGEVETEGKGMFGLNWQQILQAQIYRNVTKTLRGEGTAYF